MVARCSDSPLIATYCRLCLQNLFGCLIRERILCTPGLYATVHTSDLDCSSSIRWLGNEGRTSCKLPPAGPHLPWCFCNNPPRLVYTGGHAVLCSLLLGRRFAYAWCAAATWGRCPAGPRRAKEMPRRTSPGWWRCPAIPRAGWGGASPNLSGLVKMPCRPSPHLPPRQPWTPRRPSLVH